MEDIYAHVQIQKLFINVKKLCENACLQILT